MRLDPETACLNNTFPSPGEISMQSQNVCRIRVLVAAAVVSAVPLSPAAAADWPQWGGDNPGRNMYSPVKGLPVSIKPGNFKPNSEEIDLATTKNVKWIAKLGSQSYGNPVVSKGVTLVGTNNASPRDPRFKDDKSILYAL